MRRLLLSGLPLVLTTRYLAITIQCTPGRLPQKLAAGNVNGVALICLYIRVEGHPPIVAFLLPNGSRMHFRRNVLAL